MKRLLKILAAVLSLGTVPAIAADIPVAVPVKAAANAFSGYPYTGSGIYWGLFTEGGGGRVNGVVAGVDPNSLTTNQIGLGGALGYIWARPNTPYFYAVEGRIGYRNFNGSTPGLSLTGPMFGDIIGEVGVPTAVIESILPSFNFPTAASFPVLPTGQTITNTRTSIFAGLHIDDITADVGLAGSNKDWRFAPELGAALTGQVSNGTVVKAWVKTIFPEKGVCVGPGGSLGCSGVGQQFLVGGGVFF